MKDGSGSLYTHREPRPSLADVVAQEESNPALSGGDYFKQLNVMRKRKILVRRIILVVALVYAAGLAAFIALIRVRHAAERSRGQALAASTITNQSPAQPAVMTSDPKALRLTIQQWKDAAEKLREARQWVQKGRLDTAEALLQEVLATNPYYSEALFDSAQLYFQQDANDRARDVLQRLLTVDPQRKAAIQMLATVFSRTDQQDQALALANWIMETDPECMEAHRIAGVAARKAQRLDLALVHFRKWAAADPENISAQKQYADVLLDLKEYDKASALYEGILKKKPDEADAYRALAVCFARKTMVEQVVATLIQAVYNVGPAKVAPWFKDPGFEPVRQQKLFVLLERQVSIPQMVGKANQPSISDSQLDLGVELQRIQQMQSMLKNRR